MEITDKFDIEQQYQFYLDKIKLRESDMLPEQRNQTRQAFMGAWSQLIFLVQNEIAVFPPSIRQGIIQRMINELAVYWKKQMSEYEQAHPNGKPSTPAKSTEQLLADAKAEIARLKAACQDTRAALMDSLGLFGGGEKLNTAFDILNSALNDQGRV